MVTVRRDRAIAETMPRRSPPTRVMSEAAIATSAPVPMATPTSAAERAAASLMPSPAIATTWPCRLQLADFRCLLGGQHLGEHVLDADLGGDGVRGGRVVAGEHPDVDAECLQLGDRLGGFGFDGVGDRQHRGRGPVDRGEHRGAPGRRLGGGDGLQRGDVHAAGGHQRGVADQHVPVVDDGVDAVTGDGVEGPQRRQIEETRGGGGDDRLADGVFAAGLGGGDQGQHVVLCPAAGGGDAGRGRAGRG